jgi:hypothetical protein
MKKDFQKTTALFMATVGLMASIAAAQSSGGGFSGDMNTGTGTDAGGNPAGESAGGSLNGNARVNTGYNTSNGRSSTGPGGAGVRANTANNRHVSESWMKHRSHMGTTSITSASTGKGETK